MSKSVSSSEIEDVLSSIRRLVAAEPTSEKPSETADDKDNCQRLVLTPAFRVSTQPVVNAEEATDDDSVALAKDVLTESQDSDVFKWAQSTDQDDDRPQSAPASEASPAEERPPFHTEEVTAAPVEGSVMDDEPPTSENAEITKANHPAAPADATGHPQETQEDRVLDFSALADQPIAGWRSNRDGPVPDESAPPTLSAKVAELEAAVDHQPSDFEPDGSEEDTHTPTEMPEFIRANAFQAAGEDSDTPKDITTTVLDTAAPDDAEAETPIAQLHGMSDADMAKDPSDQPSEDDPSDDIDAELPPHAEMVTPDHDGLKAVEEEREPETLADGAAAATLEPTSDPIEQAPTEEAAPPEEMAVETSEAELDATDGVIVDEEQLRELIVEILREELHGSLGERMTQNVRKLVRREIHRVLAAKDFD